MCPGADICSSSGAVRIVCSVTVGGLNQGIRTGIGDHLAHPVTTDADDEREVHRCSSGRHGGGGDCAKEGTSAEDRTGEEESVRGGIPVAGGVCDVVDLTGENLVGAGPHVAIANGEASDQSGRDHREEHVGIENGVDAVVGCDGAEGEETQDTGEYPSSREVCVGAAGADSP